jgi:hypothetical protein
MKYFVLCLLLASAVSAQTRPRRSTADDSYQRPVNMQGTVQEVADGKLSIELNDSRIVSFKINSSTRFSDGLTLKSLQVGDHLLIQGTQDQDAYLTATSISLDAAAMAADAVAARKAATLPRTEATARQDAPKPESAVVRRPAVDPDDSGPPVLRRGKPAPRSTASSDDTVQSASAQVARPAPPDSLPPDSALKGVRDRPTDDYAAAMTPASERRVANLNPKEELIERAREWALNFTDNLPNYVCQQFTTRYIRVPGSKEWRAQDVVSANVVYESGKEDYRNIAINGRPVNKKMEELPGSWSTGEFGTTLRSLFHPGRQAEFTYVKQSYINGLNAWVYDYKVRRENSDWHIQLGSQSIIPAYNGRVWIEEKTAQVLRIEMSATDIPQEFPLDQVEASNDYGFVRLATADQYMLPTHAETLSCERGSPVCSRNTIDFRNYHKYSGEANIVFDK